ncbi:MAG TPA: ATP-binding cassette domain-containing protein [Bryobacteraceae bacterium]|jgi:phospholipid/cholesterol/gamma-HCH transport system ATP-binding protein
MPGKENTIVEFQKVSMQFGDIWALRDISFTLKPGETRVIFGQAGAGKTALLKSAIGLLHPDSGEVDLFGQNVTASRERDLYTLRSKAGVLFQEGALFDSLTIRENVAYPLENQRATTPPSADEIERRVRETLRFVELEHTLDKFPNELSGGMRRRVGIARAIVTEPPFVLYDSPTAGLDPITANTIMALIAKERDVRHTASLIVTHRYQDGELMANFRYNPEKQELIPVSEEEHHDPARSRTKFFVMKDGEIVFQGTRAQLEENDDSYVKRFVRH